ncbi:DUF7144 family membrane protein [Kutzneria sp. CA-103260]|uniref:DUF7144 family membrane protein n=1 Tax=Kutzneria sp. CA-103260 TaxID=2802641 RepID=UPI001BABE460|nr:hypothetical protein [Kutzneria sp. CA-103260]QUQ68712.1 hypothetical protein JJ691_64590 [Kutzneria sp. CA-103260]
MTTEEIGPGWVVFASVLLIVTGAVNVVEGLVALGRRGRVVVVEDRLYLVDTVITWGLVLLVFGAVLVAVGVGLLTLSEWARLLAIVIVGLHAISQVFWIGAYPVWAVLMIALDTVLLFGLTARWSRPSRAKRWRAAAEPTRPVDP